jgi:hypothetical protein
MDEALDANTAADAFSSLLGSDDPNENEPLVDDTPEGKAEKLLTSELSDDEEVTEEVPESDELTIEVDGKQVKLTKEQIAESYKNGLRQADYTRKTMEAADARKTADAETAKAKQERTTYAQQLNNYTIAEQSGVEQIRASMTQELLQNDPVEYLTLQHTLHERQVKLGEAQRILGQLNEQQQTEDAEAKQSYMKAQQDQLLAKLPDWKDPAKAATESNAIRTYLMSQGYEAAELNITDHKQILLARDAMKYRELIERAGKAVTKVKALPTKVERAGTPDASRPDGRTTAMKQLERTGSIPDAANAFAKLFN